MSTYFICPALSCDGFFLFCPNGDEKHFNINDKGVITQFNHKLTIKEINFIRSQLGEKLKINYNN